LTEIKYATSRHNRINENNTLWSTLRTIGELLINSTIDWFLADCVPANVQDLFHNSDVDFLDLLMILPCAEEYPKLSNIDHQPDIDPVAPMAGSRQGGLNSP